MEYTAKDIEVLEGLEGVRKRPAMYIGSTGKQGLHHLVYEVVDNSIDEALAGYCDTIEITIHKDNSVTVKDNGRGIPVDIHPKYKKSALEIVLTKLHAGGKFSKKVYKVSGGLHGVGVSVVNALSEWLEARVCRDGKIYYMRFERGKPVSELKVVGECKKTGTEITFKPDAEIFETIEFDHETLKNRFMELAFLNSNVKIIFKDERIDKKYKFHFPKGLIAFVKYLNRNKNPLHTPIYFEGKKNGIKVNVAIQYNDSFEEKVLSFVNSINTREGGTHLIGFRAGLTKTLNEIGKKRGWLKNGESLSGEDVREGLTAILSVMHPDPQFEGQTKTKLANSEVKGVVESIVSENLSKILEKRRDIAKKIIEKAKISMRAREAAKKARALVIKKSILETSTLPGKLADCSEKDPRLRELYIVEGDSAGGSAKQARDRRFQAILPIRGKILNVEKARLTKILDNNEIKAIISAIGAGVGKNFDISKSRYGKIIIMTDADVDGAHIRTLLLTLFFRYMKPLIEHGYVYIAQPPLYRVRLNGKDYYLYSDKELKEFMKKVGKKDNIFIQRYKGLGEMNPEQLWETTMNPKNRVLLKVTLEDAKKAEEIFNVLMGERVEPRRKFIEKHAKEVRVLDV